MTRAPESQLMGRVSNRCRGTSTAVLLTLVYMRLLSSSTKKLVAMRMQSRAASSCCREHSRHWRLGSVHRGHLSQMLGSARIQPTLEGKQEAGAEGRPSPQPGRKQSKSGLAESR